jgi:hypothetical protein
MTHAPTPSHIPSLEAGGVVLSTIDLGLAEEWAQSRLHP